MIYEYQLIIIAIFIIIALIVRKVINLHDSYKKQLELHIIYRDLYIKTCEDNDKLISSFQAEITALKKQIMFYTGEYYYKKDDVK